MAHDLSDFIDEIRDYKRIIKGFGWTKHFNIQTGTIKWHWEDDKRKFHKYIIPGSYYMTEGSVRLLYLQHWSQTQKGNKPNDETREVTGHKVCTL